jgi:type IV pilus assembly protein PilQ
MTRITGEDLVVDDRLRTVFATGSTDILEEVAIAVQALDNPGRQVMIHARILEFLEGDSRDIANALNAIYDRWHFSFQGGRLFADYDFMRSDGRDGAAIFGRPRYVRRLMDAEFDTVERLTRSRTLANPSVITIDGVEATIDLTDEFPYPSGVTDGQVTWSTVSIGPRLSFTPVIGRDDTITLQLDLQASELGEMVATQFGSMPTASQRNVTTTVRIRNGEPFVIGGLYRTNEFNTVTRIPILGSLPLLGELFTNRQRGTNTTQVIMIVIPYILDTPDVSVEQTRVMMRQRW